jgi:uncharacterized Zn finger protein
MPTITLEEILLLAERPIHERGRELFSQGAVSQATRAAADVLQARVAGSSVHPYRIKIDLAAGEWRCTCPYDQGAVCKHVYAVALAGLETPAQFEQAAVKNNPALEKLLKALEQLSDEESWTLLETLERLKPALLNEYAFNIAQRDAGW